ncbi:MAG: hypothetical protein IJ493_06825 [Clostridia bacterium]|nr:hypothetical protein [Clostridia bacterium]
MKKILTSLLATLLAVGFVTPTMAHDVEDIDQQIADYFKKENVTIVMNPIRTEPVSIWTSTRAALSTCYIEKDVTGTYIVTIDGSHNALNAAQGVFDWDESGCTDPIANGHGHTGELTFLGYADYDYSSGRWYCDSNSDGIFGDICNGGVGVHTRIYNASCVYAGTLTCKN